MVRTAFHNGTRAALKQFGVREASFAELLLGLAAPMATRAGLKVMAPNLVPAVEKAFEVPFQHLKGFGQGALRAVRGPMTPADALVRGLSSAPAPAGAHNVSAFIHPTLGSPK